MPRDGERSKSDELWLGDAFDPRQPSAPSVSVYVRIGAPRALVAELVCGCAAKALGLPAPEVFVIQVRPGILPKSKLAASAGDTLCVGTLNIGGRTFAQMLNAEENAALILLRDWPELAHVAAFDEWTANPDRNITNLIYVAQTLHIIDHADSFGGNARQLFPLAEMFETPFDNKMARILGSFSPTRRAKVLSEVHDWISQAAPGLEIAALIEQSSAAVWHGEEERAELVDFLGRRLKITHSLLCNRLGHPQLPLPLPQS